MSLPNAESGMTTWKNIIETSTKRTICIGPINKSTINRLIHKRNRYRAATVNLGGNEVTDCPMLLLSKACVFESLVEEEEYLVRLEFGIENLSKIVPLLMVIKT